MTYSEPAKLITPSFRFAARGTTPGRRNAYAEDEQYEDFKALEEQLLKLFTFEGYPYRLLKLPMPGAIYDEGDRLTTDKDSKGDRLPATYANFLILNGAVIYPTYNQPEKDEEARRQIQLAFPDREIIGVDSLTIIRQHVSIHCLTMQLQ